MFEQAALHAREAADRWFPRGDAGAPLDRRAAPAAAVLVCAAIMYFGYGHFYAELSVRPETLTLNSYLSTVVSLLLVLLMAVVAAAVARRILRAMTGRSPIAAAQATILAVCALLAVGVAVRAADIDIGRVKDGRSVSGGPFGLLWRADSSRIAWVKGPVTADERALERRCVMYLGRTHDTYVVYSPTDPDRAHLVPISDVMVMTLPGGRCTSRSSNPLSQ